MQSLHTRRSSSQKISHIPAFKMALKYQKISHLCFGRVSCLMVCQHRWVDGLSPQSCSSRRSRQRQGASGRRRWGEEGGEGRRWREEKGNRDPWWFNLPPLLDQSSPIDLSFTIPPHYHQNKVQKQKSSARWKTVWKLFWTLTRVLTSSLQLLTPTRVLLSG